jgi:hypothetical protein
MLLIDLVDQDFVSNARLDIVCGDDEFTEPSAGVLVVLSLGINHIYQCTTITYQRCLIRLERVISREVHHGELNVRVVINLLPLDLSGGQ